MINDSQDAALLYAKSWNQLDFTDWFDNLSDDCVYSSQYVLESLEGKDRIVEYLSGKLDAVKASDSHVIAKFATLMQGASLNPPPGSPCVAMYQGDTEAIAIVLFEVSNGKVAKYDLCMPELYKVQLDE